ncbi:MAG: nucleotidyltransferase [Planctomycetota bacterium]
MVDISDSKPTPQPLGGELVRVIELLAEQGVDFVVCGGIACILQGVERTTQDVDLYVRLETENLRPLVEVLRLMDLQSRIPEPIESILDPARRRAWQEQKQAKVISFRSLSGPLHVDVFLDYPIDYDDLSREADWCSVRGQRFKISSKRHLLLAKMSIEEPRKHDRRDIEDLRELLGES